MERLVKGDVVVVPFPFSDLSQSKRRPALVLSGLDGRDAILCQITSMERKDSYAVPLCEGGFEKGTLRKESNIRPNKLFTADAGIVKYKAGRLRPEKTAEVVEKVCGILQD